MTERKTDDPARAPREVVGAAVVDSLATPRRLLAARRTEPAALAGGWELPGGKVDPGETPEEALHRELAEELGVSVRLGDLVPGPLAGGRWPLGSAYVIRVWFAEVVEGDPQPIEDHDELRWVDAGQALDLGWLPADLPIVAAVSLHLG